MARRPDVELPMPRKEEREAEIDDEEGVYQRSHDVPEEEAGQCRCGPAEKAL